MTARAGITSAPAILDRLLADLAALALSRWPLWHGAEGDADPWLKAACRRTAHGLPPCFRRLARDRDLVRLTSVIDPGVLVLVRQIDPSSNLRAEPVSSAGPRF